MKTRIFSAITLIACLFALVAKGQTPQGAQTSSLPAFLPIGSQQRLWDWAATNRNCSVAVRIIYTNNAGDFVYRSTVPITDGYRFATYTAFRTFAASNGWYLYQTFKTDIKPSSTLTYRVRLFYVGIGKEAALTETNLGLASLITSNSLFVNYKPQLSQAVVEVTNLQRFSVSVDLGNNESYNYTWTPLISYYNKLFSPPFATEMTSSNFVILSEWYSLGAGRARFSITIPGQTNVFTQFGELITPKYLAISRTNVQVPIVRGADTTLLASSDYVSWTPVTNFSSSLAITNATIAININSPRLFFRTCSW